MVVAIEILAIIAFMTYDTVRDRANTRPSWCGSWLSSGEKGSDTKRSSVNSAGIAEGVSLDQVQIAQANGTYGMVRKGDNIHDMRTGDVYSEGEYAVYVENQKRQAAAQCSIF